MNKRTIITVIALVITGAGAIYLYPRLFPATPERKILYWTDPMIPGDRSDHPGKSPMGMERTPVYADDAGEATSDRGASEETEYYTCPMHPQVRDTKPGNCSICSMKLVPVTKNPKKEETKRTTAPTIFISPEKQQLIGVKTSEVKMRSLQKSIRAVGRVDYDERKLAVVTLRTSAWIQDLFVDYTGKYVKRGDPLFTVYSPELVSAQQEFLLARAAAQETNSTVEVTQNSGMNSYTSGSSTLLKTARERLRLWQFTDEQMKDLERTGVAETYVTIRSPISGYVTEKMAVKGMRVEPQITLYRIADLSTVWINADVYEYELPSVKVGQTAEIDFPYNTSQKPLQGKIIYIFPYLNPTTRVGRVRVEFPNPNLMLKPEMFVNVNLRIDLGKKLAVQHDAVLNTGTEQYVFVDKGNGYFEPRAVKLIGETDEYYAIGGGLKPGERVVTSANFILDSESRLKGVFDQMGKPSETPMPNAGHVHQ